MSDTEPDKKSLNPGDLNALETLSGQEKDRGKQPSESGDLRADVEAAESTPEWKNGVSGTGSSAPVQVLTIGKVFKKNGPLGVILLVLGIGGVGLGGILGGAGLIVNLKELMSTNIMDAVPTINQLRAKNLLAYKLDSKATSGLCTPVSIRCKFQTMGPKQVAKLEAAGIKINTDGEKGFFAKRSKVTSFEFGGKTITADKLISEMRSNRAFASALERGYSSRLSAWSTSAFEKLAGRIQLNTGKNLTDSAKLKQQLKENVAGTKASATKIGLRSVYDEDGNLKGYTDSNGSSLSVDEGNAKIADGNPDFKKVLAQKKALSEAANSTAPAKIGSSALKSSLLIGVGLVDSACTGWNIIRTASYAAKYVGALSMIRYANVFLNTADAIKAGDATPEEVAFLGDIIMSQNSAGISGVNSRGYNYAAYGDVSPIPEFGTNATAGASSVTITDDAAKDEVLKSEVTDYINGQITSDTLMAKIAEASGQGGAATEAVDSSCGFIKSGWGQAIVIGVGVAVLATCVAVNIIPALGQAVSGGCIGGNALIGAGISAAVAVTLNILTPQLIAMATDTLVTGEENGNQAVNMIVSGGGALNTLNGLGSGLGYLSDADAASFSLKRDEARQEFAAIDQQSLGPLDPSSSNTFLGKFVSTIAPSMARLGSLSGGLGSISSLVGSSFASIIPSAKAKTYGDAGVCHDPDYENKATDANCNPLVGLSDKTLSIPVETILTYMEGGQHISSQGMPKSKQFKDFVKYCPERTSAIGAYEEGTAVEDIPLARGDYCQDNTGPDIYNYFRAYLTYFNTEEGMTDEATIQETAGATVEGDITESSVDIACAEGTEDAGIAEGWYRGEDIPIRLCDIPGTTMIDPSDADGATMIRVNSRISGVYLGLTEKMRSDLGVDAIRVTDSYRSYARQAQYYADSYNGAARPGYSNHQLGAAVDFQMPSGNSLDKCVDVAGLCTLSGDQYYDWLAAHGAEYGLVQLGFEYWHWQPSGL